ncbi:MAG: hypothetical protein NWF13_04480 [Candidatus Bathyarchaeota archaeon]|nr:hypothetical protein [Candidatus Bathyarchaeota archaeon]
MKKIFLGRHVNRGVLPQSAHKTAYCIGKRHGYTTHYPSLNPPEIKIASVDHWPQYVELGNPGGRRVENGLTSSRPKSLSAALSPSARN